MKELFLLKLGEIVLKGQNRRVFEDKLKTVTRRRMAKFGEFKVNIVQSTLYVEPLTEDYVTLYKDDLRRGPDVPLPCLRKKSRRHV